MLRQKIEDFKNIPNTAQNAGGRILSMLRDAIVQLQFTPGSRISETEIAKQMHFSRQPVREAFIKLSEDNLLEILPQRGTFVKLISEKEVRTFQFIRESVEVAIALQAVAKVKATDIDILYEIIQQQEFTAQQKDLAQFLRYDEHFHYAIAHIAELESAWAILQKIKTQMDRVRFMSFYGASLFEELIVQHNKIVHLMEQKDVKGVENEMRTHLREILTTLPKIRQDNPQWFSD